MSRQQKLTPDVNRILFIKNLPYNIDPPTLFELFSKHGPVRQIRAGDTKATQGTAYVVYEDVMDAKNACDRLNGFNFGGRYLVVLYHQVEKMTAKTGVNGVSEEIERRREELERVKKAQGID